MAKSEVVRLRITPELKARLQAAAAADGRTMSNYIERLLVQALQGSSSDKQAQ
jgi:predicted HicB family RNase H-like nuclease|nr:MAG TPA: hypothetical protein [Caudoviricetes sp.]